MHIHVYLKLDWSGFSIKKVGRTDGAISDEAMSMPNVIDNMHLAADLRSAYHALCALKEAVELVRNKNPRCFFPSNYLNEYMLKDARHVRIYLWYPPEYYGNALFLKRTEYANLLDLMMAHLKKRLDSVTLGSEHDMSAVARSPDTLP